MTLTSPTTTDHNHDDNADSVIIPAPHPGEILELEFLEPLAITQYRLAKDLGVSESQISRLVRGQIGLSASLAVRLAACFGNSAEFWGGIQESHDLFHTRQNTDISNIPS